MVEGGKCKVCAEKKSNYFSIFEKVIGKDLPTIIENISGIKICRNKKSPNNMLICQDCAVSVIQAEAVVVKLRRSLTELSNKKIKPVKDETQEVSNSKQQNVQAIHSLIEDNGTTIWHFKCDHCPYESDKAKWFQKHLTNKHQIDNPCIFKCNQCSQSYQLLHKLMSHIKFVHEDKTCPASHSRNSTFPSEIEELNKKDSECDKETSFHCEEHNFDKQNKDISINNLHFDCDHCSYNSDNAKLFKHHLKTKHQIEKPRIFKCNQCSVSYQLLYGLQSHIKYVHENTPRPPRRRNSLFPTDIQNSVSQEEDDAVIQITSLSTQKGRKTKNHTQSLLEDLDEKNDGLTTHQQDNNDTKSIDNHFDGVNNKTTENIGEVNSKGDWHFKCDHCPFESDNAKKFKKHLAKKHQIEKPRIFKCNQCSETYQLLYGLESHIKYVHGNTPRPPRRRNSIFPSEIQKNSFSQEEDDAVTQLTLHKDRNNETHNQSLVEDTEEENDDLTTHQQDNNSDSESNDNHFDEKNKAMFEEKPEDRFEASNKVNSKRDWHFKCDHCPYESNNAKYFKKHLTNKHQIKNPRIFKCNQCSESYQLLYGLEYHIKRVHENKSTLLQKFKNDLPVEANVNTDSVYFKLPASKKIKSLVTEPQDAQESSLPPLKKTKFAENNVQKRQSANAYKSDSENDNGDDQNLYPAKKKSKNVSFSTSLYECNDCSYNSDNEKHFKKHLMSKHQMDNSSMYTDSNSSTHGMESMVNFKKSSSKKRSQSQTKQHTCVVCGKKFVLIDELRLHTINSHLGEVVKNCPHCGASFRSEHKYEAHVFSEKCLTAKYSCQYPNCNKRYSKSSKLRKHMQEKHPDEQILE